MSRWPPVTEARVRERLGEYFDRLGEVPDVEIAKAVGCTASTVARYRQLVGKAPSHKSHARSEQEARIAARLGEHFDQLGKAPDVEIAKATNLSRERIRQFRKLLGIEKPPRKPRLCVDTLVLALWNNGLSARRAAAASRSTLGHVQYTLERARNAELVVRSCHEMPSTVTACPLRWPPARIEELQHRWLAGERGVDLAAAFGVHNIYGVVGAFRARGWDFPPRPRPRGRLCGPRHRIDDESETAALIAMRQAGKTGHEIAAALGWALQRVYNRMWRLRARGFDLPHRPRRKSRKAAAASAGGGDIST